MMTSYVQHVAHTSLDLEEEDEDDQYEDYEDEEDAEVAKEAAESALHNGHGDGVNRRKAFSNGHTMLVGNGHAANSGVDLHNRCLNGRYWCVKDCCGIVCASITYMLLSYAEFVVLRVILLPSLATHPFYAVANLLLFQTLLVLAASSHIKTMLTDPGAVPRGNATKENIEKLGYRHGQVIFKCPKCCSIKPERAHHCSVCQRCIKKMDHHCERQPKWANMM